VRSIREVERSLFETGLFRAVGINFETGKSQLLDGASVLVDPVGDVLRRYPDLRIEVAGHTDWVGGEAFNQRLSEARAQTIATYLTERWGIDPARLIAKGYGETQPFVTNANPTGRTLNRRVEFRVLGEEQ
jgi:outer membrane protein OmpA-like peptidoglycan-associated protein